MKARAGSYDRSTDLLLAGSRSSREPVDEGPVERAKRDPAAFGDLYDRYCGLIYRYVYSRVHERALAEDITEDVFFKALRHIHQYRNMGRPFSAWLYQIANRAVADHYRAGRGELDLEQAMDLPACDSNVLDEVIPARAHPSRLAGDRPASPPAADRHGPEVLGGQDARRDRPGDGKELGGGQAPRVSRCPAITTGAAPFGV